MALVGRRQRQRDRTAVQIATPSGRYTPPARQLRSRPGWHRIAGVAQLILGVSAVVVNYLDAAVHLLPGGHSELYFVLGLVIAGAASWWFGWFDRPPTPDEVRREFDRQQR